MKKIVQYKNYPPMTCFLSSWFPFFGQGLYFFGVAFVKYVYYKKTKVICWIDTIDVEKHEYSHFISRLKRGFFNFWFCIIWDYLRFDIPHDSKPMEIEANKIKNTL